MNKNIAASIQAAELVKARPGLCWKNAANLMFNLGFDSAIYIEGAVVARTVSLPQEHGWVVLQGEIIDPTLPELELDYFPALKWSKAEFQILYFKSTDMPFFRRIEFLTDGVQVEMDVARQKAQEHAAKRRIEP